MPCFKGLAVSIHTTDGPLPEYSIQRLSKHSRITTYIPVPPAKVPPNSTSNRPEQPSFSISITLLMPGMLVPYTKPESSPSGSPSARQRVGMPPIGGSSKNKADRFVTPYVPASSSPNETVAAYIYFDGRSKEEVATLLRKGEETWVNSRWVSVPASEGGGIAERDFLFREVGLEKWLNGLDLEGSDIDARIKRRRERLEKQRQQRRAAETKAAGEGPARDMNMDAAERAEAASGDTADADMSLEWEDTNSSDAESEPPEPEAAGQIKVALFRVHASGEIKRGEYSPQFDAHDDDDEESGSGALKNGVSGPAAAIDHTTSFAKPKALDPSTISTQTVTGIDPPDSPYAVFTFLYRSERQLQKMGILPAPKTDDKAAPTSNKRRSLNPDFSALPPLAAGSGAGFSNFRDSTAASSAAGRKKSGAGADQDSDDEGEVNDGGVKLAEDIDVDGEGDTGISPAMGGEDQGELAEAVRKIKLKRAHSTDGLNEETPRKATAMTTPSPGGLTPHVSSSERATTPPRSQGSGSDGLGAHNGSGVGAGASGGSSGAKANGPAGGSSSSGASGLFDDKSILGSPMKKSRPSLAGAEDEAVRKRLGFGLVAGAGAGAGAGVGATGIGDGSETFTPGPSLFPATAGAAAATTTTSATTTASSEVVPSASSPEPQPPVTKAVDIN